MKITWKREIIFRTINNHYYFLIKRLQENNSLYCFPEPHFVGQDSVGSVGPGVAEPVDPLQLVGVQCPPGGINVGRLLVPLLSQLQANSVEYYSKMYKWQSVKCIDKIFNTQENVHHNTHTHKQRERELELGMYRGGGFINQAQNKKIINNHRTFSKRKTISSNLNWSSSCN